MNSTWSHSSKLSRTLPNIKSTKKESNKTQWQWSGRKYCIAPLKSHSCAQKNSIGKDLVGLVNDQFKYDSEVVKQAVLRETNKYRKLHSASPLKMDDNISTYAQEWADNLAFCHCLETRPFPLYGENIMCARKLLFSIEPMVKLWYQEKYDYDYLDPQFNPYTGHFTQLVWRNTEYLGVGVASNYSHIWIVCNYDPPGNIRDYFQQNVLPQHIFDSHSDDPRSKFNRNKKKPLVRK